MANNDINRNYETDKLEDSEPDFFAEEEVQQSDEDGRKIKKQKKFSLLILIFSFVIATAVWLYVESTEEQGYEKVINLVPVDIVGVQELERNNNMSVISGYDNTVNVTLVGKRSDVNKYSANDIYAYVDVSKINSSDRQMLTVLARLFGGTPIISPAKATFSATVFVSMRRKSW